MGSEIPEWAANEAEGIAASIPLGTLPETQEVEVVEIIARALVAAERRGIERGDTWNHAPLTAQKLQFARSGANFVWQFDGELSELRDFIRTLTAAKEGK